MQDLKNGVKEKKDKNKNKKELGWERNSKSGRQKEDEKVQKSE